MGWAGIKNGDLLALAEKQFELFITVPQSFISNKIFRISILRWLSYVRAPIV